MVTVYPVECAPEVFVNCNPPYHDSLEESEVEQEVEAEEEEALQYDDALEEAEVEQDVPKYDDAAPGSLPRGSVGQYTRLRLKRERMETEHRPASRSPRRRRVGM